MYRELKIQMQKPTPEEIERFRCSISGVEIPPPHADYSHVFSSRWPEVSHLSGDVAEFGVYNGGNCFSLARITGRRVWAFDTFEGIPEEDYKPGLDVDVPGKFKPDKLDLSTIHPIHGIVPVKGRFAQTLPWFPGPFPKFAMVLVDADLHESMREVFMFLRYHMVPGGIVIVDDFPTHLGVRMAVDEYIPFALNKHVKIVHG